MEYRVTPLTGIEFSPTQLLFSRQIRTKLPISMNKLYPKLCENVQEKLQNLQNKSKLNYDKNAKKLPIIEQGDNVRVKNQNKWIPGVVKTKLEYPRSFLVQANDGYLYRRNRKHINKTAEKINLNENINNEMACVGEPITISENFNAITDQNIEEQTTSNNDTSTSTVINANENNQLNEPQSEWTTVVRKSNREKHVPKKFNDFILGKPK